MEKLSCATARQIDLVDYLASLGYYAIKTRGTDHWYFSPFRKERTPSFKVNRSMNVFYDHGTGEGGNIIDFGILYHRLPVSDFLQLLAQEYPDPAFNFRPPGQTSDQEKGKQEENTAKITVVATGQLTNPSLLSYLETRCISPEIANQHCTEVDFMLNGKKHTAIGFANGKGGYELRNSYFKGSSSPKVPAFIDNDREVVTVFEGFFNFLSYLTIEQDNPFAATNYLVLNSLSFFQKAREIIEAHLQINLMLDRDSAGITCTTQALMSNLKYRDESIYYQECKDFNDWLIQSRKTI